MAKLKILKPVVNRGKLHHKIGSTIETDDKSAKVLIEGGYAEKADKDTPVTPGATIDAGAMKQEKQEKGEAEKEK